MIEVRLLGLISVRPELLVLLENRDLRVVEWKEATVKN